MFFDIIKASFMQRRKTLVNALVNSKIISTKDEAKEILSNLQIDENVRGETLSMQEFTKIENYISKKTEKNIKK